MSDEELDEFVRKYPTHKHLDAVHFEIQRRRADRMADESKIRHEQTQKLTRCAIAFAAMSVAIGLVFGVIQCRANKSPAAAVAISPSPTMQPTTASPAEQPTSTPSATGQPEDSPP
jgi:hypothetical protein